MRCVFPNDLKGCAWHTVCSYGASRPPKTEVAPAARRGGAYFSSDSRSSRMACLRTSFLSLSR